MTTYTEMPIKGMDVSQFNETIGWSKPNPPFSFSGIRVGQGKQGYYSIARGIGGKDGYAAGDIVLLSETTLCPRRGRSYYHNTIINRFETAAFCTSLLKQL